MHEKYATAVHHLLLLSDWTDRLAPGIWVPPSAIQACLPWWRSYLRELVDEGRVEERRYTLPTGRVLRMAAINDALAVVERAAARQQRADARSRLRLRAEPSDRELSDVVGRVGPL